MPLVHFRVDQRLIHGQVAIYWANITKPNHIIVANDSVANDEMQKSLLRMASPSDVRLSVVEVDKAINYLNRGIEDNERILLIVRDVIDANKFYVGGLEYNNLNIGNMGHKDESVQLTKKLYASPEELKALKNMIDLGVYCYAQIIPSDKEVDLKEIISKL